MAEHAPDDDDLPRMKLVDKFAEARLLLDEVYAELDPRPGPGTDEEVIETILELCLRNPALAAKGLVDARRRLYQRTTMELTALLDLDWEQRRKLAKWVDERIMKIGPEAPDLL